MTPEQRRHLTQVGFGMEPGVLVNNEVTDFTWHTPTPIKDMQGVISPLSVSGSFSGPLTPEGERFFMAMATQNDEEVLSACKAFMHACGLKPTPDAVDQLSRVFLPCLKIMCERPWDPNGGTWRASGRLGILSDVRKKFERLWYRGWRRGKMHDDSGFDLINFVGFYLRSGEGLWGDWGDPLDQAGERDG